MDSIEENPWKLKGKIKFISCCDGILQCIAILYATYQMFTYYWFIGDKPDVKEIMKGPGHIPFYIFIWVTLTLHYCWTIVIAAVLFSAVSLEATETDPHTSVQKCVCWLRSARLNLFVVFIKLCIQPVLLAFERSAYLYGIFFGLIEFVFRCMSICWVKMFMQDLQ
ncbi:unnamed protein product [Orchesella dallaii]|uniref:Uncharacterized protein n=1 Tax=Orchesella dallaii TaxID=48710 RepID=A0ABP1PRU8_9HEXA